MINIIFPVLLCLFLFVVYYFAFRFLPGERWQVFASLPMSKMENGRWEGVNITYYGIILSTGYVIAITLFFILSASAGATWLFAGAVTTAVMFIFIPAAKVMAFVVEGKKNTITVGGASFVMLLASPWIVRGVNYFFSVNDLHGTGESVIMAAMVTAYALGEGIGRLACISFGCCYGRPVTGLPLLLRVIFYKWNFVFSGDTKKISYHDNLNGTPVVPIQGITAILYTVTASFSIYLFLEGYFIISFFISLTVTQLWRFFSEFLRADYRGEGKISAYQIMSLFIIPYFAVYMLFFRPETPGKADILSGVLFIWHPAVFILLSVMWLGCLLYTGVSRVTAAEISLYVVSDRI
ncbi:MAG TPA: prolipoprotein diacylglyceryl transferase [Spirochaetota bacterium]|nr:prolipoprotein diacylglyceryl transferase [Spirochaetota bacterium]HPJ33480.1 prolipoprotein diacylglyceryl transferase [Spirochaetota bacterium]